MLGGGNATATASDAPASSLLLLQPKGVALDGAGCLFVTHGEQVLRVSPAGLARAIAGDGVVSDDHADINRDRRVPSGVVALLDGTVYFSEKDGSRIRRISTTGAVDVLAGRYNYPYFESDGGPSEKAAINGPRELALDRYGNLLIADTGNNRVRRVLLNPSGTVPDRGAELLKPYRVVTMEGSAAEVAIGDVDGDGLNDLVVTTPKAAGDQNLENANRLHVFRQQRDGSLAADASAPYATATIDSGTKLALADFNRDGIQDILVAYRHGLRVFPGNRAGTSSAVETTLDNRISGATDAIDLIVEDFDRDGRLDALVQIGDVNNNNGADTLVRYGDGTGRFPRQGTILLSASGTNGLAGGDFNADGLTDAVLASGYGTTAHLALNDGAGGFRAPSVFTSTFSTYLAPLAASR